MLILCDFDGTITEQDVTNLIWDKYIRPDWREVLLPPYRAGTMAPPELMAQGYAPISATAEELLAFARPQVNLRAGFGDLTALCETNGWPFRVVSQGLDWYLRAFLPPEIKFHGLRAELRGTWKVFLPPEAQLAPGEDYKVWVMNRLRGEHAGRPAVFIGDGRNDLEIARHADRVFAVAGSTLEKLCRELAIPFQSFTDFHQIIAALSRQ
ncbi:MAG: HAD-IB family phosphatase [Planctomycetota bacterium]|nr:HAD-IB family phosphatase [Planctomycetota bacterium]